MAAAVQGTVAAAVGAGRSPVLAVRDHALNDERHNGDQHQQHEDGSGILFQKKHDQFPSYYSSEIVFTTIFLDRH